MRLSVIMPVYNEAGTVREIVRRVLQTPIPTQLIIVDDGSTDGTRDILRALGTTPDRVAVLFHERNRGKGACIRTGLSAVTGEVVVIQDADLEYDPKDYPLLIQPIADGVADVVYGSRFLGGPHRVLFFWHYVGNCLLTLCSNMMTDLNLTDMETGYKAFRAEVLRGLVLRSNRFGFEPEITAKVAHRGLRIYEVPISYAGRTYAEGKKITWKDGLAALWTIFRFAVMDRPRIRRS